MNLKQMMMKTTLLNPFYLVRKKLPPTAKKIFNTTTFVNTSFCMLFFQELRKDQNPVLKKEAV